MDNYKRLSLTLLLVFTTGCSKLQSTSTTEFTGENNVYKIAVAAPQVGPYKQLGLSIVYGAELAVDLKNQNGGVNGKKIELVKVDDGGLASEGTWRAKSLVSQMVLGVVGHLNSDISISASEIYSRAMIVEISPGSTNPLFTEREGVKGYVFRTIGRDDEQGKLSASYVLEKGFKKVAVLHNNRTYGSSLSSEFVKQVKEISNNNAEIVFNETYKVKQNDFTGEINKLKEKSPDVVFFVGEYGEAANFLKQFRKSGLKTTFLGSEGVFDKEFVSASGEASEGALVISLPPVMDKDFTSNYVKKFGMELGSYSANSFDATNILILAIEKIKENNPDKIASAVRGTKDYAGLTGKISFNQNGDLISPTFTLYQVKSGMFVAVR